MAPMRTQSVYYLLVMRLSARPCSEFPLSRACGFRDRAAFGLMEAWERCSDVMIQTGQRRFVLAVLHQAEMGQADGRASEEDHVEHEGLRGSRGADDAVEWQHEGMPRGGAGQAPHGALCGQRPRAVAPLREGTPHLEVAGHFAPFVPDLAHESVPVAPQARMMEPDQRHGPVVGTGVSHFDVLERREPFDGRTSPPSRAPSCFRLAHEISRTTS